MASCILVRDEKNAMTFAKHKHAATLRPPPLGGFVFVNRWGSCVLGLLGCRSLAAATGNLTTATATRSAVTRNPARLLHLAGAIHHQRLGRGGFGTHTNVGALAAAADRGLAALMK